jgi:hypothetical protein
MMQEGDGQRIQKMRRSWRRTPGTAENARTATKAAGLGGDHPHRYLFTVFAVQADKLDVKPDTSAAVVGFNLHFNFLLMRLDKPIAWGVARARTTCLIMREIEERGGAGDAPPTAQGRSVAREVIRPL